MPRRARRSRSRVWRAALGATAALLLVVAVAWVSPGSGEDRSDARGFLPEMVMTDVGPMHLEDDYLPGVVDCEIAHFTSAGAALDAQAIAARTYLARHLEQRGDGARVPIGPHFQCWRRVVHDRSRGAARRTAGLVMRHDGELINANYAAGAAALDGDCRPPPPFLFGYRFGSWDDMRVAWQRGARFDDVAWTQIFVTDNRGRSADGVRPTVQGSRAAFNRGALGQHAAICLAERHGLDAPAILRRFYGEDIVIQ